MPTLKGGRCPLSTNGPHQADVTEAEVSAGVYCSDMSRTGSLLSLARRHSQSVFTWHPTSSRLQPSKPCRSCVSEMWRGARP